MQQRGNTFAPLEATFYYRKEGSMGRASSQYTLEGIYKEVLGDFADHKAFLWLHRGGFVHYVLIGIAGGLLDPRLSRKYFKLGKLSYMLDPVRDQLLSEADLTAMADGLLLRDKAQRLLETPQYYWMRLAMMQTVHEPNPTKAALAVYEQLSTRPEFSLHKERSGS
jgi:ribonucleoside-diphosphate reductase alpha chain